MALVECTAGWMNDGWKEGFRDVGGSVAGQSFCCESRDANLHLLVSRRSRRRLPGQKAEGCIHA